jgi:hypothetical protein
MISSYVPLSPVMMDMFHFLLPQREAHFQERIKSLRFHIPIHRNDYYGERIRTLADYRRWLRTQQAAKKAWGEGK